MKCASECERGQLAEIVGRGVKAQQDQQQEGQQWSQAKRGSEQAEMSREEARVW